MLNSETRRRLILQVAQEQERVRVSSLAERYNVSIATIRGDLQAMTEAGLLVLQHGGARLASDLKAPAKAGQSSNIRTNKLLLASRAADLVACGDKVILPAGSTTLSLAGLLANRRTITVFTNGLAIANALAEAQDVDLVLAGGCVQRHSTSTIGRQAESTLDEFVFDKLFLDVNGCDAEFGLSTQDADDARLYAHMVRRTRHVIVMVEGAKYGQLCLHRICAPEQITAVVSDASLPPESRARLSTLGIQVLISEEL